MLRLALLVLALATACNDSTPDAPAVGAVQRADAGKVIEVAGKVTATRDGATRTLAVGNAVTGDDVIATAAESSIVIELFHNHARWSLDGGLTSRVDASVAWTLPKQDAAPQAEHATSSAGRHGEREAADTQATARDLENAQDEAERRAAQMRLGQLRREKAEMEARLAAAKAAAAKAERAKGVKISKECMENPLARGCDYGSGPEDEVKAAIDRIKLWADEMCACADAACAAKVDAKHMPWHVERDKKIPPSSAKGKQIAVGSLANLERYEACKAKLK